MITYAERVNGNRLQAKSIGDRYFWQCNFVQTIDRVAYPTDEMHMLVMMVMFGTVGGTHGIGSGSM